MHRLILAGLISLPSAAFAVGTDSDTPPAPTQTTTECKAGTVYDVNSGKCLKVQGNLLDDDTLYGAAREFAYAGQYQHALDALGAMSDPTEDRVLTYLGFAHRKMGDAELGLAYYRQAIAQNPDNLLARSYMAQGFVEEGKVDLARAELTEIRTRGGRGSWAEISLRLAIESGSGYSY